MSDALREIAATSVLYISPLAAYQPPVHRLEQEGVVLARGLPPATGPNYMMALRSTPSPERVLALAEAFFADATEPYELVVDAGYWQDAEALLAAHGFTLDEEEPALVLSPIPASIPPPPSDLLIRLVEDEAALGAFYAIAPGTQRRIPSVAAATDPAVALLIGAVEGSPVATARFEIVRGVADITGVVTEPEMRRRGYGTAMTWAAVREAASRGATAATLTATEMGYPVYLRMGFLPVCAYRTYISPRRDSASP